MRAQRLSSRRLTIVLLLLLAGALGWLLVWGSGLAAGHAQVRMSGETALLTTNRDGLAVCVQVLAPDMDARSAARTIQEALDQVSQHPDFEPAGLGRAPLRVDAGCPESATILADEYDPHYDRVGYPQVVSTPSEYRTFVFVISPEQLARSFSDPARYPRTTSQEALCDGHSCHEVTVALYFTPDEMQDGDLLQRSLSHSVGLWPVDESKTDEPQPIDPRGK